MVLVTTLLPGWVPCREKPASREARNQGDAEQPTPRQLTTSAQSLAVPNLPAYHGTHLRDLLVGIAVGILAAAVVVTVRRGARLASGPTLGRLGMPVLLVAGGLGVGLIAQIAD